MRKKLIALKKRRQSAKKPTLKKPKVAPKEAVKKVAQLGLYNLKVPFGAHKRKKILGRGPGSGHGKTSTRGSKGQTSRAGRDFYPGFEGGQTPLIRRIPKRGFTSRNKLEYQIVNLQDLNKIKESTITPVLLEEKNLIKDKNNLVKILGKGEIKDTVTICAHAFSKKAHDAIKNAGGKVEIISEAHPPQNFGG